MFSVPEISFVTVRRQALALRGLVLLIPWSWPANYYYHWKYGYLF